MTNRFAIPRVSLFGFGAIEGIPAEIVKREHKKPLIVTDKSLCDFGIVGKVTAELDKAGIPYVIYNGVQPNPTTDNVQEGLKILKDEGCDMLISIGGGSPQDCAKGISILATNGGKTYDYVGADMSKKKGLDIIAVNTTAGTASEITQAYVITDTSTPVHRKMGIRDINVLTEVAVEDHSLMMSLPAGLTGGTGMDALTHAIEALTSTKGFLLTSEFALTAIKLVFTWLPKVMADLKDEEARGGMAVAQYVAGMAFGNSSCGCVHAMSHQLSAVYNLPHGLCNAILLPVVMDYNKQYCADRYALMAEHVWPLECQGKTEMEKADLAIAKVRELSAIAGTFKPLKELGVKEEDVQLLAEKAQQDGSMNGNPHRPTDEEVMAMYRTAL